MTALVLRYEHRSSKPEASFHTSENEKPAQPARVPSANDRPRFAKPLFYTLLTGIFLVHVPGIVLSALLTYRSLSPDSTMHPMLRAAATISLLYPNQAWVIVLHPLLLGIACIVRKDGGALWGYTEAPLAPA